MINYDQNTGEYDQTMNEYDQKIVNMKSIKCSRYSNKIKIIKSIFK